MPLERDVKVTKSGLKHQEICDETPEIRDGFKYLDVICPIVRMLKIGVRPRFGTVHKVDSSTKQAVRQSENMGRTFLGEFEQRVLLAILRCDAKAYPIEIRKEVTRASGHEPSRGAFYTTLDRLDAKQLVRWTAEGGDAGRDGLPQRKFIVTAAGVKALRASRKALLELWRGLDDILSEA